MPLVCKVNLLTTNVERSLAGKKQKEEKRKIFQKKRRYKKTWKGYFHFLNSQVLLGLLLTISIIRRGIINPVRPLSPVTFQTALIAAVAWQTCIRPQDLNNLHGENHDMICYDNLRIAVWTYSILLCFQFTGAFCKYTYFAKGQGLFKVIPHAWLFLDAYIFFLWNTNFKFA